LVLDVFASLEDEMIVVDGGTFEMGNANISDAAPHSVTLSGYKIGKYEVTQAMWKEVMGTLPGTAPTVGTGSGFNYPVYNAKYTEVQTFISKLNERTGKKYRLPTEAEWEFAARGGRLRKGYTYSGSHTVGAVAWYDGNATGQATSTGQAMTGSQPVGSKDGSEIGIYDPSGNELGIYDMSGNVWEWCSDWYDINYETNAQFNPKGPNGGSQRVIRGGAWNSNAATCRVANRSSADPADNNNGSAIGFRLAHPFDYVAEFESTMVAVAGGTFTMGSNDIPGATLHDVTVSPFRMGKFEVTQAQWLDIVGVAVSASAYDEGANLPVHDVSWDDVQRFIDSLYKKTGKRYRLPREAEWEYAARGGATNSGNAYSGSNTAGTVAWYDANSEGHVHLVGTKTANALGLYDMSGNVWEWCDDFWEAAYSSGSSAQNNPKGPTYGNVYDEHVMRGGSWDSADSACRVANRYKGAPNQYFDFAVGFRLVLDPIAELEANMVTVAGGTFTLGNSSYTWATPQKDVTLSKYQIGKFEITQAQWQAVMDMTGWPATAPSAGYGLGYDYPISYVSWDKAIAFIHALNVKTGLNYRLPTEAEWEYAAKGRQTGAPPLYIYSGSATANDVGWYEANSGDNRTTTNRKTHPVGTIANDALSQYHSQLLVEERAASHILTHKGANGLGIYDMSGNVYEWCSDWWSTSYPATPTTNPPGYTTQQGGYYHVSRGGAFMFDIRYTRVLERSSSYSYTDGPTASNYWQGFRVAITPEP
jgi:formylglycine-generating enzyme required for sulfatase activity